MRLYLLIHVFSVWFIIGLAQDLRCLDAILLWLRVLVLLMLLILPIEELFVGALVIDLQIDMIGGDLYLFEDVVLIVLGLNFYGLIDHLCQL